VIDPALFRLLLFGPLILTGITTLALLSLSPVVRLRRTTIWCFAGMLAVFAAWSLFDGFRYPVCSRSDHTERGVQGPRPRDRPDLVPAGPSPVRHTRKSTGSSSRQ
jgi:hypothetical protein